MVLFILVGLSIDPAVGSEEEVVGSIVAIKSSGQVLDFFFDQNQVDQIVSVVVVDQLVGQSLDAVESEFSQSVEVHSWLMIGRRGRMKAAIMAAGTR